MYVFLETFLGFLYENHHDLSQQGTYICTLIYKGERNNSSLYRIHEKTFNVSLQKNPLLGSNYRLRIFTV
jgi:hypothetical protein